MDSLEVPRGAGQGRGWGVAQHETTPYRNFGTGTTPYRNVGSETTPYLNVYGADAAHVIPCGTLHTLYGYDANRRLVPIFLMFTMLNESKKSWAKFFELVTQV